MRFAVDPAFPIVETQVPLVAGVLARAAQESRSGKELATSQAKADEQEQEQPAGARTAGLAAAGHALSRPSPLPLSPRRRAGVVPGHHGEHELFRGALPRPASAPAGHLPGDAV